MTTVRPRISGYLGNPPTSEQSRAVKSEEDLFPCVHLAIGLRMKDLGRPLCYMRFSYEDRTR